MVELRVGQEAKLFRVHKEALCKFLSGTFSDGFEQRIFGRAQLLEDDSLVFGCYMEWIYRNDTIALSESGGLVQRIKLYCFASKYRVTLLMDQLMDSIHRSVEKQRELLDIAAIDHIYKTCVGNFGIKRFVVPFVIFCMVGRYDTRFPLTAEAHVFKEALPRPLHGHEELRLAVLEHLSHSNGPLMYSREESTAEVLNCEWHEHGLDEHCVLRDQHPKLTLDQFLNGAN
jgi:hypothetical protein